MSDIPSFEGVGVAICFNVHVDNITLHVHSNGSHAIVTYDDSIHPRRRDFLSTNGPHYELTSVNGLKMQAYGVNDPSFSVYYSDLNADVDRFARSNMQPRPKFLEVTLGKFEYATKTGLQQSSMENWLHS